VAGGADQLVALFEVGLVAARLVAAGVGDLVDEVHRAEVGPGVGDRDPQLASGMDLLLQRGRVAQAALAGFDDVHRLGGALVDRLDQGLGVLVGGLGRVGRELALLADRVGAGHRGRDEHGDQSDG
jgi:hypothetical protein